VFSDSIYDLSTEHTFKIQSFPFKPVSLLYRFYDGLNWDAGYSVNELYIPDEYEPFFRNSSNYADHFRAYTIYENEQYRFNMEVVLNEPGRYVMIFTDLYEEHTGSGAPELNDEANAINFEGKCAVLDYNICSIIEGDNQIEHFETEMVYIDKEINGDSFASIYDSNSTGVYERGGTAIEWSGVYGFEVIE
jgi:hypothetical protein